MTKHIRHGLLAAHYSEPQACARLERALRLIDEGLGALSALGHPFFLAPGAPPAEAPWPRVFFHASSAPNGRVVWGEAEAAELGAGWFETLADAQHDSGRRVQYAGRGGVGLNGLPAPLELVDDETLLRQAAEAARAKAERIKEFKLRRTTSADPQSKAA